MLQCDDEDAAGNLCDFSTKIQALRQLVFLYLQNVVYCSTKYYHQRFSNKQGLTHVTKKNPFLQGKGDVVEGHRNA